MLNFLMLMLVPLAIALFCVFFFKNKVTIAELLLMLTVPAVCMVIGLAISYYQRTTDIELWNGRITSKLQERVSCRHSYACNCRQVCSGSGKSETCSTVCDTCYEHSFDYDWNVYASTGESRTIDTIDRQGLRMPPRWGAAFIGEPFTSAHHYTNYILANPDSVLLGGKGDIVRFKPLLPDYPSNIYDYYRAHHVLNMGPVPVDDMQSWNWLANELNGDLGVQKQINITLLFVKTDDPKYVLALKDHWIGGKKNDAIIVLGSVDGTHITFADVVSWTPRAIYKVRLRDDLMAIGSLNRRDAISAAIKSNTLKDFERMHMKDFEYLTRSYQPTSGAMIFLLAFGVLLTVGLAVWCVMNDYTDDGYDPFRLDFITDLPRGRFSRWRY
jgi:hypothetical protein